MNPLWELPPVVAVLVLALLFSYRDDPRKFRTGLYLLALLVWGALTVAALAVAVVRHRIDDEAAAWLLLGLLGFLVLTVVALALFLIANGVTLLRREGWGLSRLLSMGLGVVMLGYVALAFTTLSLDSVRLSILMLGLGLPLGYLGFGFVAFLLYGSLYPAIMARRGGPVVAIVVLGSGLIRGKVPPLLASRLYRGRRLYDRFESVRPLLVTSGGRGPDEPVAEAQAMAEFLVAEGVPDERILIEDRSRNTEENLANTAELLAARGVSGPVAAVTSDFHAFRAALLMRRLGLPGYSVGAPTARYYWPSAVIREFAAILRDHLWLNVILLGVASVPFLVLLVAFLQR